MNLQISVAHKTEVTVKVMGDRRRIKMRKRREHQMLTNGLRIRG